MCKHVAFSFFICDHITLLSAAFDVYVWTVEYSRCGKCAKTDKNNFIYDIFVASFLFDLLWDNVKCIQHLNSTY